MNKEKNILIIDMLNLFIRCYVASPKLTDNGIPIGGVSCSLLSLQSFCNTFGPSYIICVWDGKFGSVKKKSMYSEYKAGRSPIKLNREIDILSEDETLQNKKFQMVRLIEYLNLLPCTQLMIDVAEADDIMADVARRSQFKNYNKIIISSDKDFMQLVSDDESIYLYRPTQQKLYDVKSVVEEYDIHPDNFTLARAASGDTSDNIKGLERVGLKTFAKAFECIRESKVYSLDDILQICASKREEKKHLQIYDKVYDGIEVVKENYKIMQLYSPIISFDTKQKITSALENFVFSHNQTKFQLQLFEDGLADSNFSSLHSCCRCIMNNNRR